MTRTLYQENNQQAGRLLATWAAYTLAGAISVWLLAGPFDGVSPLYLAAGIGVGCVLGWGPRMAWAVGLGAAVVGLLARLPVLSANGSGGAIAAMVLAESVGAALQALIGAALVRRFVRQPLMLEQAGDIVRFLVLVGPVACLTNALLACTAMRLVGLPFQEPWAETAFTWWAGDTLGVLIGAPMALAFTGLPAELWRPRRWTVGLPLLLATALLVVALGQVQRWEHQRAMATLARDASASANAVEMRLQGHLDAVDALHGVYIASDDVTRAEFHRAVSGWLRRIGGLQALGWAEYVPRADVAAFEEAQRAAGLTGYRVFDRQDAVQPLSPSEAALAIRFIDPSAGNERALGVNILSVAPAREAASAAFRNEEAVASAPFRLTQEAGDQLGVVVYRAVHRGLPGSAEERQAAVRGVVFLSLRMEDALASMLQGTPGYLTSCLVDISSSAPGGIRLAGPLGCERSTPQGVLPGPGLYHAAAFTFAGRRWELRMWAHEAVPLTGRAGTWLFACGGVLFSSALAALLLVMTGRTRRIEVAVADRTRQLEVEIAERRHTERALRESEQRFRGIFDHVPIGVVYTDLNGGIRQANPGFCLLTGYGHADLMSMPLHMLAHPEDRQGQHAALRRLALDGQTVPSGELRFLTRDGRTRYVRLDLRLLHGDGGDGTTRPQGLVGVVEDITEHLKLREAERARETAEAANRAKNEFLSRMSHELRTPLNAMLGFAQLMELDTQTPLDPQHRGWVDQIQRAGWHLLDMINDVLDLSRIDSGTLRLHPAPLSVRDVMEATRQMIEPLAQRRRITVEGPSDAPGEPRVLADATRLKQILSNLLSNAVKYNRDGGWVRVRVQAVEGGRVAVEVSDGGLGMSAQQLSDLFQPFNRLGRELSTLEGTGIGLVISRRLAELMSGTLAASSVEGQGSVFTLTVPAAPAAPLVEASSLPAGQAPQLPEYRRRRVLYIEDNQTNADVMRGIFAQRPQILFEVRATGQDGLAAIRGRPRSELPNLVLLDMHLPDMTGMEVLRQIKDDEGTADIAVVFVSADVNAAQMDEGLREGAMDYLSKPVNVIQLLSLVDDVLEQADTKY